MPQQFTSRKNDIIFRQNLGKFLVEFGHFSSIEMSGGMQLLDGELLLEYVA